MKIKTRYRIQQNGWVYKIQRQVVSFSCFGHWKRKWVDVTQEDHMACLYDIAGATCIYFSLEHAKGKKLACEAEDDLNSKMRKKKRRTKQALSNKGLWKNV